MTTLPECCQKYRGWHSETCAGTPPAEVDRGAIEALLVEMEDYGKALLASHEARLCDAHPPAVQSSYVGKSFVQYAERIRRALLAEHPPKGGAS